MTQWIDTPFQLGGLTLKNRILFAPTTMGLAEEEYLKKLSAIAGGGCAMIIIGDVPATKSLFHSLSNKKGMDYYRRITSTIHEKGCLACAQLYVSDSNLKAMLKYIPGILTKKISAQELRLLLNQEVGPYISSLPTEKVRKLTAAFGGAAVRAREVGFDMVQVHGDRMCGSFLSSRFNSRTDRYGGTPENRGRFALEAISAIRQSLPDIPIDFKLAVRQEDPAYGCAGILKEELPILVPLLEAAGADSFHVALANHASLTDTIPPASHPYFSAEGCFLPYCDEVKRYTKLPVCGVGGLHDPSFIDSQIGSGRIELAAMSRQLVADPDWPLKVISGRENEIKHCIRCNHACLGGMMRHQGVHCIYDKEEK